MLVTLARFLDPWEAYVVRALLEAEGLPATVAHAHHAIANWPMSLALGGTAVQVPAPLLVSARAGDRLSDRRAGAAIERRSRHTQRALPALRLDGLQAHDAAASAHRCPGHRAVPGRLSLAAQLVHMQKLRWPVALGPGVKRLF